MKKFLSLVLALIMTMSLVTISAGATEYKELTDKDEIQYEEAVAVLNRIGVITGYSDGSFRPETELTRGAAAKIIVSLLIGPEAASNLPNTFAPYPDVPANHTFAGVISYCKTAGIISGYGDGTFKPGNSLTGYAFAKMLLGAVGYDSKIQGYTDTGWTMNVARDGNAAGLFNRIEFDGGAAVNREQACQLALNTLKATMVEYTGGLSITAGDAHVTANPTITYKTSNQSYARNISNRKLNTTGNVDVNTHWTVEFGEEHFKDLRLNDEHGTGNVVVDTSAGNIARDDFGRPSNEWSFKKVTIGTFPIDPDFVYTTQVIHKDDKKASDASKVRALELAPYELTRDGSSIVNTRLYENGELTNALTKLADIADYTDNGTRVEVYVDEDDADWINTVVVVKTQLMEVKTVKSDAVSLKLYDGGSDHEGEEAMGFNQEPIDEDVNDVEINDDCFDALKDMKAGDIVAVIPVWVDDNSKYDVSKVYVPETVSGELTSVDTYGTLVDGSEEKNTIAATVGGTNYKVALWNKDLTDIDGSKVRVTRKDVTLHLDEYGNALLAKDVGSTSDFMVVGGYHSGLVDGKVVTFADGWDIKGNELSLNIGNINYSNTDGGFVTPTGMTIPIGSLVHYSNATVDRYAEWTLDYLGVFDVASERVDEETLPIVEADRYNLKASNGKVLLNDYIAVGSATDTRTYKKPNDADVAYVSADQTKNVDIDDAGIKVIYVTRDESGEVDSIEIKSGMQNISSEEILGTNSEFVPAARRAQACVNLKSSNTTVNSESVVKAIVIKKESGSANLSDLVYISDYVGSIHKAVGTDASSKPVYGYEVHFLGQDNWDDEVTIYTTTSLRIGDFAKARKDGNVPSITGITEDNYYRTTKYGDSSSGVALHKALSVLPSAQIQKIFSNNKTLLRLMNYNTRENPISTYKLGAYAPADTDEKNIANIAGVFTGDKDLDLGGEAANNIVSIRKAKIIDLTKNGIEDADDLKDLWYDIKNRDDNEHPLIYVSLVFNDKWDDDSFRTVYAMIITDVKGDENGGYNIPGSDSEDKVEAGTLTIKDTEPTGIETATKKTGDEIKEGDKIEVTVKTGYEASAPAANATVVQDGLKYTFTVTAEGAKKGVTITIAKAAAGAVTSLFKDRDGVNALTINNSGATVNASGQVQWFANVTMPDWAVLSSTPTHTDLQKIDFTIKLDGNPISAQTNYTFAAAPNVGSVVGAVASGKTFNLSGLTALGLIPGANVSVEITKMTFTSVAVEFKSGDNAAVADWVVEGDDTTAKLAHNNSGDLGLKLDTKSSAADVAKAVTFTTEGLTTNVETAKAVAGFNGAGVTTALNGASVGTPAQDGPVVVTLTGLGSLTKADPTWKVYAEGALEKITTAASDITIGSLGVTDTNTDATLKITNKVAADTLTGLKDGTSVALQATVTKAAGLGSTQVGYLVTVVVDGKTLTGVCTTSGGAVDLEPESGSAYIDMNADKQITSVTVSTVANVTPGTITHTVGSTIYVIEMGAATKGSGSDGEFIAADFTITASTSNAAFVEAKCVGTTIELKLSKPLESTEKIALTTTIVNANDPTGSDKATAVSNTLTVTDGAESWGGWQ